MRPLASIVREQRALGLGLLVEGMPFAIAGFVEEGLDAAAFTTAWMCVGFGAWMYVLALRRPARREIGRAVVAPIADRDCPADARRRVIGSVTTVALLNLAMLLACYATGWLGSIPFWSIIGGQNLGMGAALLVFSRWLHAWERAHGQLLLIEPKRPRDAWRRGGNASSISRPGRYFREPAGANASGF